MASVVKAKEQVLKSPFMRLFRANYASALRSANTHRAAIGMQQVSQSTFLARLAVVEAINGQLFKEQTWQA